MKSSALVRSKVDPPEELHSLKDAGYAWISPIWSVTYTSAEQELFPSTAIVA